MDEKTVPYIVYEGTQARNERTVKRLIIALIVSIVGVVASNAYWLHQWTQYDYESEVITYTQDGRGLNTINLGVQEDVSYGTDLSGTPEEETP